MSKTPRTEQVLFSARTHGHFAVLTMADFARQLERELEAWKQYAVHAPTCPMPANACDCGLAKLMAGE